MGQTREQQSAGLSIEHVDDQIVVYTFHDSSRDTIDAWVAAFQDHILSCEGESYRVVMDVSAPHMSFTPYFRQRSQEVIRNHPEAPGYLAMIFGNRFFATILDFFMRSQRSAAFQPKTFTDRAKALAWVRDAAH